DGSYVSRHTSRDECYEAITEDGEEGTYRITCPDREVEVTLILGTPEVPTPPVITAYYVDATNGSDSNDGSFGNPFQTLSAMNAVTLNPGDYVYLARGETWAETLTNFDNGAVGNPITFTAYGSGARPVVRQGNIRGQSKRWHDIDVDGGRIADERGLRMESGANMEVLRAEIFDCKNNGLQIADVTSIHVGDLEIHDCLRGSYTGVGETNPDAHGISVENTQNLTSSGTIEIYRCSGDSVQIDPGRAAADNIDFTGSINIWWTGPLASDFDAGWLTGTVPGENAIDTKVLTGTRMSFLINNLTSYGWDGGIANMAVLNIKEGCDFVLDGGTFYDNDIVFRLRGGVDNPDIRVMNTVSYDNERVIRIEDGLNNLEFFNNTVGSGNTTVLQEVGSPAGFGTGTDIRNNAFHTAVPSATEFNDASNVAFVNADVFDEATNDYRLLDTATTLIDDGDTITAVTQDRLGQARAAPYAVGAYEQPVATTPDANAYYDNYLTTVPFGTLVDARDLRSDASIATLQFYPSARVSYDATENAARLRLPVGLASGTSETPNGGNRGQFDISPISSGVCLLYWEAMWDAQYGVQTGILRHKYMRGDGDEPNNANRGNEMRADYSPSGVSFSIRMYPETGYTLGGEDNEPTPNPAFLAPYNVWVGNWIIRDFDNDTIDCFAATALATTPVAFHDNLSVVYSGSNTAERLIDRFTCSWNTSQSPSNHATPMDSWFRNIIIIRDIPTRANALTMVNTRSSY
ncbi:MAG: hypothetical protein KTR33_13925, partial [Gammaproteobacteria bacterium]|nr:hypothetical protein [Gammaproteobacteria bacterium]